jgi:two-component system sensor histidine kinase QseC
MKLHLGPSIARRLMVALLLAYMLVWAVVVTLERVDLFAPERGGFDMDMLGLARAVAQVVDQEAGSAAMLAALRGLSASARANAQTMHQAFGFPTQYLTFQVHDAQGGLVASGGSHATVLPLGHGPGGFFSTTHGGQAYRVHRGWSADRSLRIDVVQSMTSRQQTFAAALLSGDTLTQLLLGFPLLLVPVWLAVRTGLRPLRQLSAELAARKPSDLLPMAVQPAYRELAPVVQALNGTLARLQSLLQRERAFLADAAHELRTPLAVIAAQCDTLLRTHDPQQREEAARRLGSGLARSTRLVNQLLALVRLDANVEDEARPIDLANVARDCLAMHAGEAQARDVDLGYAGPDSLLVASPGHAFESVLSNLVANSIRHGRQGGRVEVALERQEGGEITLAVRDDGPGIPTPERQVVFERFRRGPASTTTGSGLGLAIVAAAARQLGGRIDLAPGFDGGGLEVVVRWRAHAVAP